MIDASQRVVVELRDIISRSEALIEFVESGGLLDAKLSGTQISALDLPTRAERSLRIGYLGQGQPRRPILTVEQLTKTTEEDILRRKNLGWTSLNEICEALAKRGLRLLGGTRYDKYHPLNQSNS